MASPGSIGQDKILYLSKLLSMSGTSSELSFSNRSVPSNLLGLCNLPQLCDPEIQLKVLFKLILSNGIQKLIV